jgi:hypothetical protein
MQQRQATEQQHEEVIEIVDDVPSERRPASSPMKTQIKTLIGMIKRAKSKLQTQ